MFTEHRGTGLRSPNGKLELPGAPSPVGIPPPAAGRHKEREWIQTQRESEMRERASWLCGPCKPSLAVTSSQGTQLAHGDGTGREATDGSLPPSQLPPVLLTDLTQVEA